MTDDAVLGHAEVGHAEPPPFTHGPFPVVPGQGQFGPVINAFDQRVDELLDLLRGQPVADRLFTVASHLGDFSVIWHLIGITRGVAKGRPEQALVLAALLGAESLVVNQGIKRLFRRQRPTVAGDERFRVRQPSTSAFPSGHASSAAFAVVLLSAWDDRRLTALWMQIALIVASSRAYVRIHHGSDVIAGAAVGAGLGLIGRRVARRVLGA